MRFQLAQPRIHNWELLEYPGNTVLRLSTQHNIQSPCIYFYNPGIWELAKGYHLPDPFMLDNT